MQASSTLPIAAAPPSTPRTAFLKLTLGSIGVVYGDIGTSPLYAFREAMAVFSPGASGMAVAPSRGDVLGVLSLILWALIVVVTVKYVAILLRADNQGEGGTLSLLALAGRTAGRTAPVILLAGAAGAALFYGDALITPAISVLSAVEGLKLVTSAADDAVVPITLAIIVALFLVQHHGTAAVSAWFGPITLVWFLAMAVGGGIHVAQDPAILAAIDPRHGVRFLVAHGRLGLAVLGAVFLVVTGAEALYADLGHFGRRPIQWAWLAVAFPSLAVNYLGQGALVLAEPGAMENPFYLLYPGWALVPMVVLASLATIIASQAVITGAYSLTRQAIQLGLLPRMKLLHTSAAQEGQIYIPSVNALLLVGVVALVLAFGSSSRLASAYGIAVTGTMVLTCVLAIAALRHHWKWCLATALALIAPFLAVDLVFLGANLMKLMDGGYVPLLIAVALLLLMSTWRRGRLLLAAKDREAELPLDEVVMRLQKAPPATIPGTGVYLTAHPDHAPLALMHSLKHFKVLHQHVVILTVRAATVPRVGDDARVAVERIDPRFLRVTLTFGYMEEPDVPAALTLVRTEGWTLDLMSTSFLMSRRSLRLAAESGMPVWRSRLFMFLARNAAGPTEYFRLPAGRVVEVGAQVNV